jgi:hypothetical protein
VLRRSDDHDDYDDVDDHEFDYDHDVYLIVDCNGAEAVAAGFLAAFVVATEEGEVQAQGVEIEGLGELWRVVEFDVEFEVEVGWVWVAWVGWGAVGFESDVFVGVAGCGAVGGSEFFY